MTKPKCFARVDKALVIQVVRVNYTKGLGIEGDPVRPAVAYFSLEGDKLWESDDYA